MPRFENVRIDTDTDCEYCGYPLFAGDTAVFSAGNIYCADGCANADQRLNDDQVMRRLAAYSRPNIQHQITEVQP